MFLSKTLYPHSRFSTETLKQNQPGKDQKDFTAKVVLPVEN